MKKNIYFLTREICLWQLKLININLNMMKKACKSLFVKVSKFICLWILLLCMMIIVAVFDKENFWLTMTFFDKKNFRLARFDLSSLVNAKIK